MNVYAIRHDAITGCYAYDKNTLIVKLETGKDITAVNLFANDPYVGEFGDVWKGNAYKMKCTAELKNSFVWQTSVTPQYKRLQYYFEIVCGNEKLYLFEDGLHNDGKGKAGTIVQYFKFAWLNPADVCVVPKWAEDVVWYQIFPDRFCRSGVTKSALKILPWGEEKGARFNNFYGGNIRGIIDKLGYIKGLGVGGLYLTPIMRSDTNHRYNVHDYKLVDSELGSNDDLKELIEKAHGMGLKIMLDAVFNHCGREFFAWRDVVKNGKNSKYFNWFFINSDKFEIGNNSTKDGRYYSFSFAAYMPKLNTNNQEVMDYFIDICKGWIALGVDGIRFDVGNEISHAFLKKMRTELKAVKPDLYLLGEIWHRSLPWLMGDEYDSVMNYQFLESVNDFMVDKKETSRDLMYALNESYNIYYKQINGVLFNMLDNHDVDRAVTRCKSIDSLLQELTVLMTMPGSPSIYYGTETGLCGEVQESRNRRCMDWSGIDSGKFDNIISEFKKIVALKKLFSRFKDGDIEWRASDDRLVHYLWKNAHGEILEIYLNASDDGVTVSIDKPVVYSRLLEGSALRSGGIAVLCS
ncbi:MAG: alpha amylase N-terminal ig-like domain-containing protein [Clostridiales bacterium]|nr:alpha amylase N-terminal ig-like domain-containing protein [Clostridiales bacterium]